MTPKEQRAFEQKWKPGMAYIRWRNPSMSEHWHNSSLMPIARARGYLNGKTPWLEQFIVRHKQEA